MLIFGMNEDSLTQTNVIDRRGFNESIAQLGCTSQRKSDGRFENVEND